jgi:hypothetical protein
MTVQWNHLMTKMLVWLAAEVFLSILGLDNLADYGEFMLSHEAAVHPQSEVVVFVVKPALFRAPWA